VVALAQDTEQRLEQEELDEILQRLGELTRREREVLDLLVDGKPVRTVARALGTAHSTVRNQRASILKKMRADTVADLMKMMAVVHRNVGSSNGS
jgi:FixJ family two-component response regulator